MNTEAFEREGLARLEALLKEISFVKRVKLAPSLPGNGWDAEMTLRTSMGTEKLLVECKRRSEPRFLREAAARFELARLRQPQVYPVLVAAYLSPESAAICQQHRVGYMDFAGNCHLSFGHIHIHREGLANPFREPRGTAALFAPKAERVLRALLDPEVPGRSWTIRELAQHTAQEKIVPSVSLGEVHKVVKALCDQDFAVQSDEGVRLLKPEPLLLEWAKNYRFERNKATRFYSTLSGRDLEAKLAEIIERVQGIPNCEAAFASFSAAARIKPHVRQHRQYLYLKADTSFVTNHLELKEVASGENVVVLAPYDAGVFYQAQGLCTGAVQTYLDVNASGGRGPEAAEHILTTVLRKYWGAG